jgi:excisionase family DNA binding protein
MVVLDGEEYLTGEEAAAALGVKRETLYAYVSRGFLRSYRQGIRRQRLYRRSDVERLVQLSPSSTDERLGGRSPAPEVPLAESWIRD